MTQETYTWPVMYATKSKDPEKAEKHMQESLANWLSGQAEIYPYEGGDIEIRKVQSFVFRRTPILATWNDGKDKYYSWSYRAHAFDKHGNRVPPPFLPVPEGEAMEDLDA